MYTYNFQERRLKIKLLQQRALEQEALREQLEDTGMNPLQVAKELHKDRRVKEMGPAAASTAVGKLPFEEDKRILNNLGVTNTGLSHSHKQLSNTKLMYEQIDRVVKKHNEIRARRTQKLKDAEKKN